MDKLIPDKEYFRIGEVSEIVGVEPYVIRYWESEFKTIRPVRTKSDQRLYRKKDVRELLIVKNLLYRDQFTISGAKRQLLKMREETTAADPDRKRLIKIKKELQQIRDMLS
ncbi:MAG: MerR family transcriptional regulator [Syntrophales bacterium]